MSNKYDLLKERVLALEETNKTQAQVFTDMVILFTLLMDKKVVTMEELQDRRQQLQDRKEKSDETGSSTATDEGETDA